MSRGEAKFVLALTAICVFATTVVGVSLTLLGAGPDALALGYLLVITIGGLGGGYAYDRYKHPPENH